jgi:hypothetical protein
MPAVHLSRRNLLAAGGFILATGVSGLLLPARAEGLLPTNSMPGGANNYRKGAPTVDRIGKGGFWMSGTVRRAGDGAPLAGQRIQIWAHTTEGQEARAAESWRDAHRQERRVPSRDAADHSHLRPTARSPRL